MEAAHEGDSPATTRIVLDAPNQASLLALLVGRMLAARVDDPRAAARIARMRGDVRLTAGEMTVGIRFEPGQVRIVDDPPPHPAAWVRGDVATLLALIAGHVDMRRLLAGRLRGGGDPRLLVQLWRVLRAPTRPAG
jgi:hypothetical protein